MEPSSMLALMAVIGGIATSFFMPYAGAVVDFSDHRLSFGKWCAAILTLTNVVQIFIKPLFVVRCLSSLHFTLKTNTRKQAAHHY